MKAKITVLVIIGLLLTSCGTETATQEMEVVTKTPVTQAPVTQEPVATEEFVAFVPTEPPTETPTESPLTCVTLLAPENGVDLPAMGKVTFSWTQISGVESYVLNFILPSGATTSFETDLTFRDRYMEAFVSGGKYQWQVTARGADGNDICVSQVFAFNKPVFEQPQKPKGDGNDGANDESGGGGTDESGGGGTSTNDDDGDEG